MKKLLHLLAPIMCVFALASCGGGNNPGPQPEPTPTTQYKLTIDCSNCYIDDGSGDMDNKYDKTYNAGDNAAIKIVSATNFYFDKDKSITIDKPAEFDDFAFDLNSTGKVGTFKVTMNSDINVRVFAYAGEQTKYNLTVTCDNCTINKNRIYTGSFKKNSEQEIYISADDKYFFDANPFVIISPTSEELEVTWSPDELNKNGTLSVTMTDNIEIKVNAQISTNKMRLSITCYDSKVNDDTTFVNDYIEGTIANVKITPNDDYYIDNPKSFTFNPSDTNYTWSSDGTLSITMDKNISLYVTAFTYKKTYTLSIQCDGCTIDNNPTYEATFLEGKVASVEVKALGNSNLDDNSLEISEEIVHTWTPSSDSKSATLSVTMNSNVSAVIKSTYPPQEYTVTISCENCYIKQSEESTGETQCSITVQGGETIRVDAFTKDRTFEFTRSSVSISPSGAYSFPISDTQCVSTYLEITNIHEDYDIKIEAKEIQTHTISVHCINSKDFYHEEDEFTIEVIDSKDTSIGFKPVSEQFVLTSKSIEVEGLDSFSWEQDLGTSKYFLYLYEVKKDVTVTVTAYDESNCHHVVINTENCKLGQLNSYDKYYFGDDEEVFHVDCDTGCLFSQNSIEGTGSEYCELSFDDSSHTSGYLNISITSDINIIIKAHTRGMCHLKISGNGCDVTINEEVFVDGNFEEGYKVVAHIYAYEGSYIDSNSSFIFPSGFDFTWEPYIDNKEGMLSFYLYNDTELIINAVKSKFSLDISCADCTISGSSSFSSSYDYGSEVSIKVTAKTNCYLDDESIISSTGSNFTWGVSEDGKIGTLTIPSIDKNSSFSIAANNTSDNNLLRIICHGCTADGNDTYSMKYGDGETAVVSLVADSSCFLNYDTILIPDGVDYSYSGESDTSVTLSIVMNKTIIINAYADEFVDFDDGKTIVSSRMKYTGGLSADYHVKNELNYNLIADSTISIVGGETAPFYRNDFVCMCYTEPLYLIYEPFKSEEMQYFPDSTEGDVHSIEPLDFRQFISKGIDYAFKDSSKTTFYYNAYNKNVIIKSNELLENLNSIGLSQIYAFGDSKWGGSFNGGCNYTLTLNEDAIITDAIIAPSSDTLLKVGSDLPLKGITSLAINSGYFHMTLSRLYE